MNALTDGELDQGITGAGLFEGHTVRRLCDDYRDWGEPIYPRGRWRCRW